MSEVAPSHPGDRDTHASGHEAGIQAVGDNQFVLSGPLSFASVRDLWQRGQELFDKGAIVSLDLGKVTHTDSAGLALLVDWACVLQRAKGRLELRNVPQQLQVIARTSRMDELLQLN